MVGICRREYTINETSIGHFLWKYCIYNKIKIKLPLLKNYMVLLKKNKNKKGFRILERFPTKRTKFFSHFLFRFLLTRDFRWVTERIWSPIQNLESIENEKENEKKNI